MFTSETKIRVRYAETDQMRVVYHGNYFAYFEASRAEAIRQLGLSYSDMEKNGILMPVIEVQAKYIRPVVYDQLITVRTILEKLEDQPVIEFLHEILNESGQLLATGKVVLVFLDAATMKKVPTPLLLKALLKDHFNPAHGNN